MTLKNIKLKKSIRLFAILLFLTIIMSLNVSFAQEQMMEAPLNPEFIQYLERLNNPRFKANQIGLYEKRLIPNPIKIERNLNSTPNEIKNATFPERFDLREKNKLTPIRNQHQNNSSCWTFAAYSSLESWLMPVKSWDFAENHMKNTHGFDYGHDEGGNRDVSTAYLARGSGPVLEEDDPYNGKSNISPENLSNVKLVKNVLYLPNRLNSLDNDYIKWALTEYGAVQTSYYDNQLYFNVDNKSYYYSGTSQTNHAVVIVGWDDNYSKSNFKTTPLGNGAFIIKNSWGDEWGENGYFYISYYDTKIGSDNAVFINAVDTNYYDNIYQYDPLGNTGFARVGGSTTNWFANVFSSKDYEENLVAAAFYTRYENIKYEIWIDTDFIDGDFSKLKMVKKGTIDIPGYHTIDFEPEIVQPGKKFVVAVKASTTGPEDYYPIPLEKPIENYSSKATANIGESYASVNGQTWFELTTYKQGEKYPFENTNVNLKAFTRVPPIPVQSISLDYTEILLKPKQAKQLIATVLPEDATNKSLVWTTENQSVATVDKNGVVTAIGLGKTNILATTIDGNHSAICEVEVVKYPVKIGNIDVVGKNITISISKMSEDIAGTVIIQAYDESNRPLKVMYSDTEILKNNYSFDFNNTIKPISHIKVFIWDSIENMKPLANSVMR